MVWFCESVYIWLRFGPSVVGLNRISEYVVMGHFLVCLVTLCLLFSLLLLLRDFLWIVMNQNKDNVEPTIEDISPFEKLREDLLIEILIRVPISEWEHVSSVRKQWASLFRGECLWQTALNRTYPLASRTQRWIGPIRQGLSKRRFVALYISRNMLLGVDTDVDEILGHIYLFLKDQLELSTTPSSGLLIGFSSVSICKTDQSPMESV